MAETKDNQLSFDFFGTPEKSDYAPKIAEEPIPAETADGTLGEPVPDKKAEPLKPATASGERELKPQDMRRSVLGWLASQEPSGMALGVPTRVSKFKADAAAFWSKPDYRRMMRPAKTVIVEIRRGRGDFWPDCAESGKLLPILRELKTRKEALEAKIRAEEPHLKDTDILFDEYATWNYAASSNREYHKCLRRLEETEKALYSGSRFERIRSAHVANHLYLAAPAGTIAPNELADGWGLLAINPDMSIEVLKEPETWDCPERNQYHLIQNIAAKSLDAVLFANGVHIGRGGKPAFLPIPRKRRPKRRSP